MADAELDALEKKHRDAIDKLNYVKGQTNDKATQARAQADVDTAAKNYADAAAKRKQAAPNTAAGQSLFSKWMSTGSMQ